MSRQWILAGADRAPVAEWDLVRLSPDLPVDPDKGIGLRVKVDGREYPVLDVTPVGVRLHAMTADAAAKIGLSLPSGGHYPEVYGGAKFADGLVAIPAAVLVNVLTDLENARVYASLARASFSRTHVDGEGRGSPGDLPYPKTEAEVTAWIRQRVALYHETWIKGSITTAINRINAVRAEGGA